MFSYQLCCKQFLNILGNYLVISPNGLTTTSTAAMGGRIPLSYWCCFWGEGYPRPKDLILHFDYVREIKYNGDVIPFKRSDSL